MELTDRVPGSTESRPTDSLSISTGRSCSLRRGAQNLRDAPRLRDATPGNMRLSRVENFADCADPSVAQMFRETLQEFTRGGSIIRMNFQPCIDKRSDQPCPYAALMVRALPRTQIACLNRLVRRIRKLHRAQ